MHLVCLFEFMISCDVILAQPKPAASMLPVMHMLQAAAVIFGPAAAVHSSRIASKSSLLTTKQDVRWWTCNAG